MSCRGRRVGGQVGVGLPVHSLYKIIPDSGRYQLTEAAALVQAGRLAVISLSLSVCLSVCLFLSFLSLFSSSGKLTFDASIAAFIILSLSSVGRKA